MFQTGHNPFVGRVGEHAVHVRRARAHKHSAAEHCVRGRSVEVPRVVRVGRLAECELLHIHLRLLLTRLLGAVRNVAGRSARYLFMYCTDCLHACTLHVYCITYSAERIHSELIK